ncbi:BRICHOS domain-containing protein 5 [Arapaima gigas]
MLGCWSSSAGSPQDSQCSDGGPVLSLQFPYRAFWGALATVLLVAVVALGLAGHIGLTQARPQSELQLIRITAPDRAGNLINQSVTVDQHNDVVTYTVTSHTNHTSTVMFDIKHGVICYKPEGQNTCFLHKMEKSDYDNMHSLLNESQEKVSHFQLVGNETQRHTELLGVLGGHHVDVSTLHEPLQSLCLQSSIYWVRKADGPAKQRLIYFCIDICFPSNVCVSVCFYYLPE